MSLERLDETNHARADLYETLGLLSERLNYAKRFDSAVAAKTAEVKELKSQSPAVFAAAVAGVAVIAGVMTFVLTRSIVKKFKK